MEMKVASLKRFNKTNKPLDRLTKNNTEKIQITQVRKKTGALLPTLNK